MNMRWLIVFFHVVLLSQKVGAQVGFNHSHDFGQIGLGWASILLSNDTITIYGGIRENDQPAFGLLFSQFDTSGNLLHYKVYNDTKEDNVVRVFPNSFIKLANNEGYAGIGGIFERIFGFLILYNLDGSVKKVVEYPDDILQDYYIEIIEVSDGFFILGNKQKNNYHQDIFLMKIDKEGNKLWEKSYGHPTRENFYGSIVKLNDNEYVIGGATSIIPPFPQLVKNTSNFYVIDSLGNLKSSWQSQPSVTDRGVTYGMQRTEQGGWIYSTIEGQFEPPANVFEGKLKLIERDSNYNIVNEQSYGDFSSSNFILNLKKLSNGDLLMLGQRAVKKTPPPPYTYTGLLMGSLLRITPSGDSIWNYLDTAFTFASNIIYDAVELSSGSIIACGYSETTNPLKDWGWIIKISKDGCIDTLNCMPISSIVSIPNNDKINVYPNPSTDVVYLDIPEALNIEYQIFDIAGILVLQGSQTGGKFDIRQLNSGGYILKILGKHGLMVKKIIKI